MTDTRNGKQATWWHDCVTYEIYVPSFSDSNGDGFGDIRGIINKLEYLCDLGVDCLWLTPIMTSPFADCGYDISNYYEVDPKFGSMADFELLLEEAHKRGIKIILDIVFGHTSDQHPWFIDSCRGTTSPYHDYYVWHEPVNGTVPNNWYQGCMCASSWTYVESLHKYYYHAFVKDQPQLNLSNPLVQKEIYDIFRFWLDKGIDGYRLDAVNFLLCEQDFRNNPGEGTSQRKLVNLNQMGVHAILKNFRSIAQEYGDIMLVGEVYPGGTDQGWPYYGNSENQLTHVFNFTLLHLFKDHSSYHDEWGNLQLASEDAHQKLSLAQQLTRMWKYNDEVFSALHLWPTVVLGNHDQPRIASILHGLYDGGYQKELERLAPFYEMTLQGSPFLYYGEELGMVSVMPESIDYIKDIHGLYYYNHLRNTLQLSERESLVKTNSVARDHCRGAFPYSYETQGGFTTSNTPWPAIIEDYSTRNAQLLQQDPNSLYHVYRTLIALRKTERALQSGTYIWPKSEHEHCFAFARCSDTQWVVVIMNLSSKQASYDLHKEHLIGESYQESIMYSSGSVKVEKGVVHLSPFSCVLLQ